MTKLQGLKERYGKHAADVGKFWQRMKEYELKSGVLLEVINQAESRHTISELNNAADKEQSLQSTSSGMITRSISRYNEIYNTTE